MGSLHAVDPDRGDVQMFGSSGESVGESVGMSPPVPWRPSPLRSAEGQDKNLSKKETHETSCVLPLVGTGQDGSPGACTERARTGTGAAKQTSCSGGGFVGR